MLPSAIIIFREMFEIVLIVGIVLAATRGMVGRMPWILSGLLGGLFGSAVVAYFTDEISAFAEGTGQEIFNASILFIASFFIGWTVLWMSRHGREMKKQFQGMSEKIQSGDVPHYSLAIAIALAVWREGAEIILFSYGMLASGQPVSSLVMGGLLGGSGGFIIGLLVYFGLVSLPAKYFFRVTSGLLILLVAGMVLQGVGFLLDAGYFEGASIKLWDSSWLISEKSTLGQSLKAMVGYKAKPTLAELIAYLLTLMVLVTLIRRQHSPR